MWNFLFVKWSVVTKFYVLFVFPFLCTCTVLWDRESVTRTFNPHPIQNMITKWKFSKKKIFMRFHKNICKWFLACEFSPVYQEMEAILKNDWYTNFLVLWILVWNWIKFSIYLTILWFSHWHFVWKWFYVYHGSETFKFTCDFSLTREINLFGMHRRQNTKRTTTDDSMCCVYFTYIVYYI